MTVEPDPDDVDTHTWLEANVEQYDSAPVIGKWGQRTELRSGKR